MSMKTAVKTSSLALLLLLLTACETKAQKAEDEIIIEPQEQYEQGNIETHSTE